MKDEAMPAVRRRTNELLLLLVHVTLLVHRTFFVQALVLLSDIPTPSFVIDIDSLPSDVNSKGSLPIIHLPTFSRKLSPTKLSQQGGSSITTTPSPFKSSSDYYYTAQQQQRGEKSSSFENSVGYLHSSVVRAREDADEKDEPKETFLAELDLSDALCFFSKNNEIERSIRNDDLNEKENKDSTAVKAHLVLGLNNHHVGSYYWARSAGMGSSMEAPGISFEPSNNNVNDEERGILRWDAEGGPFVCNSNDGKRSEWVNFLRIGDNVQLLPHFEEEAIMAFVDKFGMDDDDSSRIYGVSSQGRPLGSEPMVICKWV